MPARRSTPHLREIKRRVNFEFEGAVPRVKGSSGQHALPSSRDNRRPRPIPRQCGLATRACRSTVYSHLVVTRGRLVRTVMEWPAVPAPPEGTLTEDLIRFAVPVRPNCQSPRVPRVPATFGRGEAPRVQIAKIPSSPPVPRATVITPGGAKRGDSTRRGESVGEEGCSFKQGVRQSEACRFKQGEKQSEACCARRKRASRVQCSSMVTSSLGLVTKRDQPRVGVRGSRHQKRPIAAWSSHQKRKCALGGRHAEQATHATRHGEHALLPKQLCRQAQLERDTSAGRSCGKRAAWRC